MRRVGVLLVAAGVWWGCGGSVDEGAPGSSAGAAGGAAGQAADAASEASGDADAAQPVCGDPAVMARYQACSKAADKAGCEANGGSWGTIGLAPYEECQCPTGQQACACVGPDDGCLGPCIAEPVNGVMDCTGVTKGHCSGVRVTVGCWCFFDGSGAVQGMCVD